MSDRPSTPPDPPTPPAGPRRFPSRQLRHHELRAAHVAASDDLASIDTDLEAVLARRRGCLDTLADLRGRLNVRYTANHIRRRNQVDEPPVPPAPAHAEPLESIDLRSVCLTILRRHGPQRLRDLHGLLHCYGYFVASARPVQRLGDAMAYEERCGRARRVARGTYEAVADAPEPPRPGWWGPSPSPDPRPLPWTRPETDPGPPLIDPRVADDPELWSGRSWPDPPARRQHPTAAPDPADFAVPPPHPSSMSAPAVPSSPGPSGSHDRPHPHDRPRLPASPTITSAGVGDDSSTNRPRPASEAMAAGGVGRPVQPRHELSSPPADDGTTPQEPL
ncbi:MAG TPA: hypothetical protein VFU14_11960 [Acidimicrobiales bacterium]|nr:hypothetical protein [Acidimicrobiales bacterium]